jgi:hypothetical protein
MRAHSRVESVASLRLAYLERVKPPKQGVAMCNETDRHETDGQQLVEYEAWLETLYTMHVPFEEQEDPTPSRKLHVIAEEGV